jgi:tetratricopeptide (TPR) repeat protein
MKAFFVALVLPLCLGLCSQALAQRTTETMIVIQDGELSTGAPHGTAVKRGQSLSVYNRSGGRVWVVLNSAPNSGELGSRGRTWGWIDPSYLLPPDKAVRHFSDAIQKNPKDPGSYLGRASAEFALNRNDKAIADCGQAVKLDPNSVLGFELRATAWIRKEQPEKAIADLDQVLRLEPKRAGAYRLRGEMWERKENFEKAIADFSHVLQLNSSDCYAYGYRGYCRTRKREYEKAIADFDEVLSRDASASYAYKGRGEAWMYLHAFDRAEEDISEGIRLDETAAVSRWGMAWRYLIYRDFRDTLAECVEIQKAFVHRADAYVLRADCREAVGDSDRAFADISEALWIDPTSVRGLAARGDYWLEKNRFDLAMADFDAALKLDPKFALSHHLMRGSCLAQQGRFEKARADFDEALRLGPDDQRACNGAAWFLATCNEARYRDGKKAVALGTKACQKSDWQSSGAIDTLAAAYAEAGKFDEAVRWQTKALELAVPAAKKKMSDRLALYKAGKPYRARVQVAQTVKTAK